MRGCKLWKPRIVGIDRPDEAARQILYFMEVIMSRESNPIDIARNRRSTGVGSIGYIGDVISELNVANGVMSKMVSDVKLRISRLRSNISGKPGDDEPITDDEIMDELEQIRIMLAIIERGDMKDYESIEYNIGGRWEFVDSSKTDD